MYISRSTSIKPDEDVAIYLYGEAPPLEMLLQHKQTYGLQPIPMIIACQNDHDAMIVIRDHQEFLRQLGEIVEVIQQSCGPRKLTKDSLFCLDKAEEGDVHKDETSGTSNNSSMGRLLSKFNKKEVDTSGGSNGTMISSRPRYTSQWAFRTVS
jgi:hypothetical protein